MQRLTNMPTKRITTMHVRVVNDETDIRLLFEKVRSKQRHPLQCISAVDRKCIFLAYPDPLAVTKIIS